MFTHNEVSTVHPGCCAVPPSAHWTMDDAPPFRARKTTSGKGLDFPFLYPIQPPKYPSRMCPAARLFAVPKLTPTTSEYPVNEHAVALTFL